ncbi:MAG: hypothetical protein H6807_04235 [Planctomycetes bacterium]|nr:hypothetical protein [Planctomycetota bacterium]
MNAQARWTSIFLLLLGSSVATAQTVRYAIDGALTNDYQSFAAGPLDLDRDGFPDFLVGGGDAIRGISGLTGKELFQVLGNPGTRFGERMAVIGDIDADGLDDFIASDFDDPTAGPQAGRVTVHSGAGGGLIYSYLGNPDLNGDGWGDQLGFALAGGGDIDGDGVNDFIYSGVGDYFETNPNCSAHTDTGQVYVRSGATGALLATHVGAGNCMALGQSVAILDDLDGDGRAEYAVGSMGGSLVTQPGTVQIFDGYGNPLRLDLATLGNNYFGENCFRLGDIDGDGVGDYAIGCSVPNSQFGQTPTTGYLYVFSGQTGTPLRYLTGSSSGDRFGASAGDLGDLDGDGHDDFFVTAWGDDQGGTDAGAVFIYSGQPITLIGSYRGEAPGTLLGSYRGCAALGDTDLDGIPELAIGSGNVPGSSAGIGRVRLLSARSAALRCSTNTVSIAAGGVINYDISVGPIHAGKVYFVIGSATGVNWTVTLPGGPQLNLIQDSWFHTTTSPALTNPIAGWLGFLDGLGRGQASLTIPASYLPPSYAGITLYDLALVWDQTTGLFETVTNVATTTLVP